MTFVLDTKRKCGVALIAIGIVLVVIGIVIYEVRPIFFFPSSHPFANGELFP